MLCDLARFRLVLQNGQELANLCEQVQMTFAKQKKEDLLPQQKRPAPNLFFMNVHSAAHSASCYRVGIAADRRVCRRE